MTITGMGGTATASHISTARWSIEDDRGTMHDLIIPDTRYCPEAPFRLLCPQHVAQQSNEPSLVVCITTHQATGLSPVARLHQDGPITRRIQRCTL